MSFSWKKVAKNLLSTVSLEAQKPLIPPELREEHDSEGRYQRLDAGQRASLSWIAKRLPESGVVLADEVGTGKTRIACAVVRAVLEAGGRAAVVVPHGLMHQWKEESWKLCATNRAPKELTTFTEFLRTRLPEDASWGDFSPRPDESEWWLISHGFRSPLVRNNSDVWRAALPAFVGLYLASPDKRRDGRTRIGRLKREVDYARDSRWGWKGMARIAREVAPHVREHRDLLERIEALPPLNGSSWNNDKLLEQFDNSRDGRPLTEELLGLWLGEFDLLVIDEAHKSRGEADGDDTAVGAVSGSVLSRLVNKLLKQSESGKRLCLTATPMELDLKQWLHLLGRERARSNLDEDGEQVVEKLHDAASRAAVAPDEELRLDELCRAARAFTKRLAPYVTQRRRDEDPLIKSFRAKAELPEGRPHPHRRLKRLQIGWTGTLIDDDEDQDERLERVQIGSTETVGQNSPWLDVLFAAECMSQSARGLALKDTAEWPRAVRDAYTKLSAGHVSVDLAETSEPLRVPEPGVADDHTRGKIERTAYWYRRLGDYRRRMLEELQPVHGAELNPDAEHPRIVAAVNEIESWTLKRGEKVLVFGVFLSPLRLLRDVLNVRHVLRAADAGRPIAHAVHTDKALLGIARRQLDCLRAEGKLSSRLAKGNDADMYRALADGHAKYEADRESILGRTDTLIKRWSEIEERDRLLAETKIADGIRKHLVAFLVDEQMGLEERIDSERLYGLGEIFWNSHVVPELGDSGGDNAKDEDADEKLKQVYEIFCDDDNLRIRSHAVLLHGENRWSTRRYIQAAFNRASSSPKVLIAQSQVGREGLNLHESCRVVVQFHAEWNPAVLEQQIGRVDRKGSLWEQRAREWLAGGAQGEPPFVEVRQLIFEGTYDAFQWDRVMRRQHVFDASLFGSLLPADAWECVPDWRKKELLEAAPSFSPVKNP